MKKYLEHRTTTHHTAPQMEITNDGELISRAVRFSQRQLDALGREAEKIRNKTKTNCGWSTVVRIAVDDFLTRRKKAKA